MTKYDYDLFVIGAGSGGVRAARIAANYGARVAVAELREEVLRESGGATIHAFDRKRLLNLQENSGKQP